MSEKIYAWLLRLYPSHFLEMYGDAAIELFRDRARDERGLLAKLRLWFDLLADLALSLPREHRRVRPALVAAPVRPFFHFLEGQSPRPGALVFGGLLSLVPVFALSLPIARAGDLRPRHLSVARPRRPLYVPWSAAVRPALQIGAHRRRSGGETPGSLHVSPVFLMNVPQDAPAVATLDDAERRRVIQSAIADVKQHYFAPDIAQKMADALDAHRKAGDYDRVTDPAAFANLLKKQLRDASHDLHLDVVYVPEGIPDRTGGPSPESRARYQKALEEENCTFEKVEIRAHNVGYFKLNSFPDVAFCRQAATAAMAKLNGADAIVFDLRDNRGGYGEMVALIAAYLFDHPEYLYSPREAPTEHSWTRSPVPGSKLADKPAYVLTSGRTASAAEQFSYALKMLKRITLVGETTRGATHAAVFYRIDDHFGIAIPEVKAINPFSDADWEEVGVEPDVKVPAADALEKAGSLAEGKLRKK